MWVETLIRLQHYPTIQSIATVGYQSQGRERMAWVGQRKREKEKFRLKLYIQFVSCRRNGGGRGRATSREGIIWIHTEMKNKKMRGGTIRQIWDLDVEERKTRRSIETEIDVGLTLKNLQSFLSLSCLSVRLSAPYIMFKNRFGNIFRYIRSGRTSSSALVSDGNTIHRQL